MFPEEARSICLVALTIAAEGGKADIAKPMHGLGSGVLWETLCHSRATRFGWSTQCSSAMNSGGHFMRSKRNLRRVSRHHSAIVMFWIKDRLQKLKESLR